MKQKDINTGIITPDRIRWNYTDKDVDERTAFENAIVKYLDLPENWAKILKFSSSGDFITLQENTWHKAEIFRRFKRGKEATIQADLKERLTDHFEWQNRSQNAATEKSIRELAYKELVKDFIETTNNEYRISYHYENEGLQISLLVEIKNWWDELETTVLFSAYIKHSGEIKEPEFSCNFRQAASIKEMQIFIDKNIEYHNKIMAKAAEIKSQLPADFFTKITA